jgi:hypothetical protein
MEVLIATVATFCMEKFKFFLQNFGFWILRMTNHKGKFWRIWKKSKNFLKIGISPSKMNTFL